MITEPLEIAVPRIIAEVLAVDLSECLPNARFFADLGGESIDLLDLQFQIEKHLGIRVKLDALASGDLLATDAGGVITPESLAKLRDMYAFVPVERLRPNPTVEDSRDLLTVRVIIELTAQARAPSPAGIAPAAAGG